MSLNGDSNEMANGWRTASMYTFSEAAQLARVSTATVKNWLLGYTVRGYDVPPLFPFGDSDMVSFIQMIEIMVAARFRKSTMGRSMSFRKVRQAYLNAQETWDLEYPFAHLKLEALGGHIVHFLKEDSSASFQALDAPLQWTLPGLVRETISQLDYEYDLVSRWFPIGKTVPIVIDPRLSTGLPTILGRGVTVQAIRKRFKAGLKIEFIAKDYQLEADLVETALQYWEQVAA